MHVQYVVICDSVILGNDGRPSLIGIFNDLQTGEIPITLARVSFAARLLFTADEVGRGHRVEVVITDPEGEEIGRPGGDVSLPPAPPGVDSMSIDVPLQFEPFQLTAYGRYTFLLQVDDKPGAAVQLTVRRALGTA